jgi:hypothetical protein
MRAILYSKPGCHLCDELKVKLLALQQELNFNIVERNIEENLAHWEQFRYLIPVLDIEGGPVLYPPHSWDTLRRAIQNAVLNNYSISNQRLIKHR